MDSRLMSARPTRAADTARCRGGQRATLASYSANHLESNTPVALLFEKTGQVFGAPPRVRRGIRRVTGHMRLPVCLRP
jgi:hypothetical protein